MMNLDYFKQTLPTLPENYEWDISTYMIDTFKFGWHLRLIKITPKGWLGMFDKRETYRGNVLTTYTNDLPEQELRDWAAWIVKLDRLTVDNNKEA